MKLTEAQILARRPVLRDAILQTPAAVMETRGQRKKTKRDLTPEEQALEDLHRRLDYYPTPPWAARFGAELILARDPGARRIGEPACGEGHMAGPLAEFFPEVIASDIYPHGFGQVADFMDERADYPAVDWIMTNPPFVYGPEFLKLALKRARRGVLFLLRLAFFETEERYSIMQDLTLLCGFSERVPMTLGGWDPKASTATAYAFFMWDKEDLGAKRCDLAAPGTRDRLTRPDDARRYGRKRATPLFADL